MLRIPENLSPYVDFDDGDIIAVNLPQDLESDFADLKEVYKKMKGDSLSEY